MSLVSQIIKYTRYRRTIAKKQFVDEHGKAFAEYIIHPKTGVRRELELEAIRTKLKGDKTVIDFVEYGAGSQSHKNNQKTISEIAKSSLSLRPQCRQLQRIVDRVSAKNILELGTSLGMATMYMGTASARPRIYTLEGDPSVANVAQEQFDTMGLHLIELVLGRFEDTLQPTLDKMERLDLAFLDGNHRYEPTMAYFEKLLPYCHDKTVLIFDDIYWSEEMEKAWKEVKQHPRVAYAYDLFTMGVVGFSKSPS